MTAFLLAPTTPTTIAGSSPQRIGPAVLAALVANLAVYTVASAADAGWLANGQTVSWYLVVFATAVSILVGAEVTWLLAGKWAAPAGWRGSAWAWAS